MNTAHFHCATCHFSLINLVERDGFLLHGNAPIVRVVGRDFIIEQRCPQCKTLHTTLVGSFFLTLEGEVRLEYTGWWRG